MLSTPEFLDALGGLALFDAGILEEVRREQQKQPLAPRALAAQLVEQGLLTLFQAERVVDGRGSELLLGPYVILDRLAKGGMGTVYRARHRRLDRIDAVKVIRDEYLDNTEAVQRFEREARAAAKMRHPNVVLVHDAGEAGGIHYMAMEYVQGTDLAALVKERGPLPVALACEYARQTALGLQHIHERGLVHRDIKPANLLVQQAGSAEEIVKIVDLGLVRSQPGAARGSLGDMTQFGAMMGTPDFLAPEQAMDARSVDIRADLYSLGCTLYYLLTAEVPFPGNNLNEKILAHQLNDPVPVRTRRRGVPKAVADVVERLMQKKPQDRYQTPAEVAAALADILKTLRYSSAAQSANGRSLRSGSETPLLREPTPPNNGQPGRKRWLRVLGALAFLLAIATGAYLAWDGSRRGSSGGDGLPPTTRDNPLMPPASTGAIPPPTAAPPATRSAEPRLFRNSVGMEFVLIRPGSFDMGSPEKPQKERDRYRDEVRHRVVLTKGFWMQTTLVTQQQWAAVLGEKNNRGTPRGNDLPVNNVSWGDTQAFCDGLRKKEAGRNYRLPWEAEWEYAARAGTVTPFWQGQTISTEAANFDGEQPYLETDPKGQARDRTTPVKQFPANPWGLRDMGGNLWQWCGDWYGPYPEQEMTDPQGPDDGKERVLRGGSYGDPAKRCRAATRNKFNPGERYPNFGFRVILPADAVAPGGK
jgi:serine/threonine-protein kinase